MVGELSTDHLTDHASSPSSSVGSSQPSSELTTLTTLTSSDHTPELIRPTSSSPTPEFIEITQPPPSSASSSSSLRTNRLEKRKNANTKTKSVVLLQAQQFNPYSNVTGIIGTGSCCVEMESLGNETAAGGYSTSAVVGHHEYDKLEPIGGGGAVVVVGGNAGEGGGNGYDHLMKRRSEPGSA